MFFLAHQDPTVDLLLVQDLLAPSPSITCR